MPMQITTGSVWDRAVWIGVGGVSALLGVIIAAAPQLGVV